ncbi:MAG: asparagine synthase (glutamine-hydrolyzing) [Calditerrivibrio sp.]|nr:asparagine synthase (glutamine-hydrolyzing) [Calditerrivibrio sp.]
MCGIFVSLNLEEVDRNKVIQSLIHRGPDYQNSFNFNYNDINIFVCHTRLKIIDLSDKANQPMSKNGVYVLFNGEIFNYVELKHRYGLKCETNSDTEVILLLYQKFERDFFKLLDGMFSIVIIDIKKGLLIFGRDKMGEKPLYLYHDRAKNVLIISSKIQTIISSTKYIKFGLNYQAIYDLLTFSFIPENYTIFRNIFAVQRGFYGVYDMNKYSLDYLKIDFCVDPVDKRDLIKTTEELVLKNIVNRSISDVKIGSFLSGGLDSTIVSILLNRLYGKINTFSVGFKDNFDVYHKFSNESYFSDLVSDYIKSEHYKLMLGEKDFLENLDSFVDFSDQPFGSISGIGIMLLSKLAKDVGVKVIISGDGADELFGGYIWHLKAKYNYQSYIFHYKPKGWHYYCFDNEKKFFLNMELFKDCASSNRFLMTDWKRANPKYFIDLDREFYLPNEMMVKLDRMTMAYGVEGRAGFISNELLKFSESLVYSEVLPTSEPKFLLKRAFRRIIPEKILNREKHGFNPPIGYWIRQKKKFYDEIKFVFNSKESLLIKSGIVKTGNAFMQILDKNPDRLSISAFSMLVLNRFLEKYKACSFV